MFLVSDRGRNHVHTNHRLVCTIISLYQTLACIYNMCTHIEINKYLHERIIFVYIYKSKLKTQSKSIILVIATQNLFILYMLCEKTNKLCPNTIRAIMLPCSRYIQRHNFNKFVIIYPVNRLYLIISLTIRSK